MASQDRFVTLTEAAKLLGISRTKLWSMVRNGEVEVRPDSLDKRQRLVSVRAINVLLARRGLDPADEKRPKKRFVSDGAASNPEAVPSDRIKDWVRATWHRSADS